MEIIRVNWKRLLILTVFAITLLIVPTSLGLAHGDRQDTQPPGNALEDDLFLTGDTIDIDGPVNGDVFAIGRTININGPISGSLFVLGRDIVISNEINGSVYSGGLQLELTEDAVIGRNIYFIGLRLVTDKGSSIGQDLTVLSLSASLSGSVGRELNTIIGLLDVLNIFQSEIDTAPPTEETVPENDIEEPTPEGSLSPSRAVSLSKFDGASKTGIMSAPSPYFDQELEIPALQVEENEPPLPQWLITALNGFVTLLVFGLLALWIIPSWIDNSARQIRIKPLQSTGLGFLGVVLSVNMIGVVLLLGFVIAAIGFFLGVVLIWALAWSVWAMGFSSLAIATTLFALFVLFISKVIVAYFLGNVILERISPKAAKYRVLSLLLGLLIYAVLIAIPYVGWVVGLLVTAVGLGAAWLAYMEHRREHKEALEKIDAEKLESSNEADEEEEVTGDDEDESQPDKDTEVLDDADQEGEPDLETDSSIEETDEK